MSQRGKMAHFAMANSLSVDNLNTPDGNANSGAGPQTSKNSIWDNVTDDLSDITTTPVSHERSIEPVRPLSPRPFFSGAENTLPDSMMDTFKIKRPDGGLSRNSLHQMDDSRQNGTKSDPRASVIHDYSEGTNAGRYRAEHSNSQVPLSATANNIHISTATTRLPSRFANMNMPLSPTSAQIDRWKAVINQAPPDALRQGRFGPSPLYPANGLSTSPPPTRLQNAPVTSGGNEKNDGASHAPNYQSLYFDVPDAMPPRDFTTTTEPPRRSETPKVYSVPFGDTEPKEKPKIDYLDYEPGVLKNMPFSALQNISFDEDPSALPKSGRDSGFAATIPVSSPLPERLSSILYAPQGQQSQMLESLSFSEWEDAGDWIIEQMGNVMKRLVTVRKDKRRLMMELEDEVFKRHELVQAKRERIDEALGGMRRSGGAILRDSLSPGRP